MPGLSEDSQVLDEKPSLSTLLAHLDPGKRTTLAVRQRVHVVLLRYLGSRPTLQDKREVRCEIAIIDGRAFVEDDEEEGTVQSVWTVDEMMRMKEPDR